MHPSLIRLVACCAVITITASAHGLVNGQAPDHDDTRFDAVAAFSNTNWLIENPQDHHVHNWFGGAVLIAPDVVLFAKHLIPRKSQSNVRPNSYMVRFRRHTDGSLGSKKNGPQSYHQVPIAKVIPSDRTDLALGILAKPVTHIQPVRIHFDAEPLEAQTAYLAGWGSESKWRGRAAPRNGLRIGKNKIATNNASVRILSYQSERRELNNGKQGTYVVDENAVPNMHDSGGSIFKLDAQGEPILCGIISSYTSGSYLPAANTDNFPIKAATQGGKALIDALTQARKKQNAPE